MHISPIISNLSSLHVNSTANLDKKIKNTSPNRQPKTCSRTFHTWDLYRSQHRKTAIQEDVIAKCPHGYSVHVSTLQLLCSANQRSSIEVQLTDLLMCDLSPLLWYNRNQIRCGTRDFSSAIPPIAYHTVADACKVQTDCTNMTSIHASFVRFGCILLYFGYRLSAIFKDWFAFYDWY